MLACCLLKAGCLQEHPTDLREHYDYRGPAGCSGAVLSAENRPMSTPTRQQNRHNDGQFSASLGDPRLSMHPPCDGRMIRRGELLFSTAFEARGFIADAQNYGKD